MAKKPMPPKVADKMDGGAEKKVIAGKKGGLTTAKNGKGKGKPGKSCSCPNGA